jgi:drug/metabolite transporter (DMT)-like permease
MTDRSSDRINSSSSFSAARGVAVLLIGVFFVSWASILIKLSKAEPTTIAFFRMFFSTIMVMLAIPFYKGTWFIDKRDFLITILSGILLGLHFYTWVAGLKVTSISSSVVLVTTQPIFVAILGYLILKEKVGFFGVIAVILGLLGSYLVARGDLKIDPAHLKGDILSLMGAFFAGCYLFLGRFVRPRVDLIPYVVTVYGISSLVLLVIGLSTHSIPLPTNGSDYFIFFLLALGPTILGHNLYNYALRHLPAFPVGISILGEPVLATIWGIIIFGETPLFTTLLGGFIIIMAIVLVMTRMRAATEVTP